MKKMLYYFLIIIALFAFAGCAKAEEEPGKYALVGIYLESSEGKSIFIDENGSPIVITTGENDEKAFKKLKDGDKIEITHNADAMVLSYPSQLEIATFKLIEKGSADNVPKTTLDELKNLGWNFNI